MCVCVHLLFVLVFVFAIIHVEDRSRKNQRTSGDARILFVFYIIFHCCSCSCCLTFFKRFFSVVRLLYHPKKKKMETYQLRINLQFSVFTPCDQYFNHIKTYQIGLPHCNRKQIHIWIIQQRSIFNISSSFFFFVFYCCLHLSRCLMLCFVVNLFNSNKSKDSFIPFLLT